MNGHSDEESNLIQLLKCRATDHWIGSGKYLSHEVTNEIIEMMAHHLPRNILVNIRKAKLFALISDETQDITGLESLVFQLDGLMAVTRYMKI